MATSLHIVGGFLGSGKTTAIIGAAKHLVALGKRVGVVTNDQGRYLVDTAFFRLSDVPTVEVTGGCFCCHYDDLDARLDHLMAEIHPDVIFAESVGSCADIIATVVKPLRQLRAPEVPASFTVFTDIRLLRRRLLGQAMPFSDDVVHIFDKQIEEAGLLVINKQDLLPTEEAEQTLSLARERLPGKQMRLQSSLDAQSVSEWVIWLEGGMPLSTSSPLDIDYVRYGRGEAQLAWLDEEVQLTVPQGAGRRVVTEVLAAIARQLEAEAIPIGHVKALLAWEGGSVKISFASLPTGDWRDAIPDIPGTSVSMVVNARAETQAATLERLVRLATEETVLLAGGSYQLGAVAAFHPGPPNPTHRMS